MWRKAVKGWLMQVERERTGRERAENCMQEAHSALEKHRESLEENHTASLKAATTIHSLKVPLPGFLELCNPEAFSTERTNLYCWENTGAAVLEHQERCA